MKSLIALLPAAAGPCGLAFTALPAARPPASLGSDPQTLRKVPGTRITMNATDPTRRGALIAYLRTATA